MIIHCIGKDDKLGLRINKDFFIHKLDNNYFKYEKLVIEILNFIKNHHINLDSNFSVIVNQGPGSYSGIRIALTVAMGLEISKKVRLFGYKNTDLKVFNQENVDKLVNKNYRKKLIKPIYLS